MNDRTTRGIVKSRGFDYELPHWDEHCRGRVNTARWESSAI